MADPLVIVAPLAVTMVMLPVVTMAPPDFLKPNVLVGMRAEEVVVEDDDADDEGFFRASSPLLRPASEGERWMLVECVGRQPFSDTLASSVLPVEIKAGSEFSLRKLPIFSYDTLMLNLFANKRCFFSVILSMKWSQ